MPKVWRRGPLRSPVPYAASLFWVWRHRAHTGELSKKWAGRGSAGGGCCPGTAAIVVDVTLGTRRGRALVDSGCSYSLATTQMAAGKRWGRSSARLETMTGEILAPQGCMRADLSCAGRRMGSVEVHLVRRLPGGVDMILGLDLLAQWGVTLGLDGSGKPTVLDWGTVNLGLAGTGKPKVSAWGTPNQPVGGAARDQSMGGASRAKLEDDDFEAAFNGKQWTVKWRWKEGSKVPHDPPALYGVREEDREAFDREVSSWIDEGILVKWDKERHGSVNNFVPLMARAQDKGPVHKVRPVLDYRRLNQAVESYPGDDTPVCHQRLREWRLKGRDCAIVDLKKAYLQIHIDRSLWPYQAVLWKGERYVLTRLGFGLAMAPKVMTRIVEYVLEQDPDIKRAASSYIDDVFVLETVASAERVRQHLGKFGLRSKAPERLGKGDVRVLGLKVSAGLEWSRDAALPTVPEGELSRKDVHSLVGNWVGHYPRAGWLRVACAYLQRCTSADGVDWGDPVSEQTASMVREIDKRLRESGDPVHGQWPVNPHGKVVVWVDASSLAEGAAIEVDGQIVQDWAHLRQDDDVAHINRSELNAALHGMNLAIDWGFREFELRTDSKTVYNWLRSVVQRTHRVRSHAMSEKLIQRRLAIAKELIHEYGLDLTVTLVRSAANKADALTRMPAKWLRGQTGAGAVASVFGQVRVIHERNHFGVDRTLHLAREALGDGVSRRLVKRVVARCEQCARIDPALRERPGPGRVTVHSVWQRLAADVTHVKGRLYLTMTDCGSGFTVWHPLRQEAASDVREGLERVFAAMSPPSELLSDNGAVFHSREVQALLGQWKVSPVFSGAYRPQGNGVAERIHRSVKRTVARTRGTVDSAVFWHNVSPGTRGTSPFELVFGVRPRMPGVRDQREEVLRPEPRAGKDDDYPGPEQNPYAVGETVYLRPPHGRCDSIWTGPHRVTAIRSAYTVELDGDGVSRNINHIRHAVTPLPEDCDLLSEDGADTDDESSSSENEEQAAPTDEDAETPLLRRSARARRPPDRYEPHHWW